jgi:putative phosphoribosyl transferase
MRFADRREAGRLLAERLLLELPALKDEHPVVLALPRGGVPVAFEVARALAAPLGLVLVRKIGMPLHEEYALGAIADGEQPVLVVDQHMMAAFDISPKYLDGAKAAALLELERRRRVYLGKRQPIEITGRSAIIVDDGIATGATTQAALRATRQHAPARLILAVPVAAQDTLSRLEPEADKIVCLEIPADFRAVGQFYVEFSQLQDAEVNELLDQARL